MISMGFIYKFIMLPLSIILAVVALSVPISYEGSSTTLTNGAMKYNITEIVFQLKVKSGKVVLDMACQKCSDDRHLYSLGRPLYHSYDKEIDKNIGYTEYNCNKLCMLQGLNSNFICGLCIQVIFSKRDRPQTLDYPHKKALEHQAHSNFRDPFTAPERLAVQWEDADVTFQLLNGSVENLKKLSRQMVLENLWAIEKIKLSPISQRAMWKVIKGNRSTRYIKSGVLKSLRKLMYHIPERDLYALNMTDWDIIRFLGTIEGFTRRQLGIVAYALTNEWGEGLLSSPYIISVLNGIICGFPPYALATVTPETFLLINKTIFKHVTGCSPRQMRVLLKIAQHPQVFGPLPLWTTHDVESVGLLVTQLTKKELRSLHPDGVHGFQSYVVEQMTKSQLLAMRTVQIQSMESDALAAYRRKTGITSTAVQQIYDTYASLLTAFIIFWIE